MHAPANPMHTNLRDLKQMAVNGFFSTWKTLFFAKMMCTQKREVVVWINVIERQDQVDEGLATAKAMRWIQQIFH